MLKRSLDIEANTLDVIDHTPTVFPPNSKPYGSSYGEWSIKWWKWVVSIPRKDNPGEDKTGTNSGLGQRGPVWFLAGTFKNLPIAERKCTLPFGKAIFFPVIVSEKSFAEFPELKTESQLRDRAKEAQDRVSSIHASIDHIALANLDEYRVQSPPFFLSLPQNNVFGAEAPAGRTKAVSEGYWIMLKPLCHGNHEIKFGGEAYCRKDNLEFKTEVTYYITVE